MIIIDEIESCLNQFISPTTFKSLSSRDTFDYLQNIIKFNVSRGGKLIALDGDLSERSYNFLDYFTNLSKDYKFNHIVNTYKKNKRNFIIQSDEQKYKESIYEQLDANKKIVIVSLSSGACFEYEKDLKERYPNKQIKMYVSKTDG